MICEQPRNRPEWWDENGGIVLLIAAVVLVATFALLMRWFIK